MKLTFRFVMTVLLTVVLVTAGFTVLQWRTERDREVGEINTRAAMVAAGLQAVIQPFLRDGNYHSLAQVAGRFNEAGALAGVGIYSRQGGALYISPEIRDWLPTPNPWVSEALAKRQPVSVFEPINGKTTHFYAIPILEDGKTLASLVVAHDASDLDTHLRQVLGHNFALFLTMAIAIAGTLLLLVRWNITAPLEQVADWLKTVRLSGISGKPRALRLPPGDILGPLAEEVTQLTKSLERARTAAQQEARLRESGESLWTAERLKQHVKASLNGKPLFIVSNREPFMHTSDGRKTTCIMPAGGVVTALDPIMRATGGTWIAHGSGDADFDVTDAKGRVKVPPEEPAYTLRRVQLSKEDENGYYYGFCNEGLWPLCHIVHTRPIFRLEDWICFQKANEKFADAVLDELEGQKDPLVLVQDFHLALLPYLIKQKRPDAKVGLFWHVPWPNQEAFGICPWKKEILIGMLGADLIGFHTQYHCNNFLETVDRTLESKINWDRFAIERGGEVTIVKPYPISVAFPSPEPKAPKTQVKTTKAAILAEFGIQAEFMGVGVDRIDYTKGILERFQAIERFLEKYPEYIGRFTFIELGAPSRTLIKRYSDLNTELEAAVLRINRRFENRKWRPIIFLRSHHGHEKIDITYHEADVCMVTSLHDGMNLVAKEYVMAKDQENGVLILSQFTGAARELTQALIVNPYDIEGMADAIHDAVTMDAGEQKLRMNQLRATIRENNVYRWAGNLVSALSRVSIETPPVKRDEPVEIALEKTVNL